MDSPSPSNQSQPSLRWHRVLDPVELPEGRVKTVSIELGNSVVQVCLTHFKGVFAAIDNSCPHQGGPLGEGSIEVAGDGECYLRCPWHGWDFHPTTGKSPGGFEDGLTTYPTEMRTDGVYVGIEVESPHERTVTDVMAETMVDWGVTHVFGMVGHSNLGLADAVRRQHKVGKLGFTGVRHEGAAAFAASAFGKLTGRPAACLTIAGPGATNLMTGCWDAHVDRAPMLTLTGQVKQQFIAPGYFQDLPLLEAFAPVTAFNQMVLPASDHGELMAVAIKTAIIERGVANLIFPDDLQTDAAKAEQAVPQREGRIADYRIEPPEAVLEEALKLLRSAKRPAIIVGHGAKEDVDMISLLAETLGCPIMTTFKAKGVIGDCGVLGGGHPLGAGVLGRSGTPIASWFMNEADLLVIFGASLSNHTGVTDKKAIIQVDFDRMNLGKWHPVTVPIWGEISTTSERFLIGIRDGYKAEDQSSEVAERWSYWREEKASRLKDDRGQGISSVAVFEAMNRVIPHNAIIAVDVGNNAYSFGRYFESSGEQSVLMSGYLGSIGFGYPAGIGAWAATQAHAVSEDAHWEQFADRPVVVVTGDGGFGQYAWEVNTAVKSKMNLTHILLVNNELGKISKEQRAGQWEVWETTLTNPNIAEYVTSCGGLGIRVTDKSDLQAAMEKALSYPGPATVEVLTDAELI